MSSHAVAEKTGPQVIEDINEHGPHHHQYVEDDVVGKDFTIDQAELPEGYFRSIYFWGSMISIGLSVACGVGGFSFIAPILSFINEDIGPSANITWVALTYTLTESVTLMLVGRLTGTL